jgi:RNA polymerase sigma-70 factor (ECF subfamily)
VISVTQLPKNKELVEKELIDRARKGSVDAFEQLVMIYQDRLYRFLLVRAASRADAEDALQEAFVAAFRYLSSYKSRYQFSTWLFTIAVRQLGRLRQSTAKPESSAETIATEQPGPQQLGIQAEHRESLWDTARSHLGEAQFTALWLFYVEDMPIAEIGIVMKRPVSWVKVNLMRARRRLSQALRESNFEHSAIGGEVPL